jgi:Domain of unknown function (DUF4124)
MLLRTPVRRRLGRTLSRALWVTAVACAAAASADVYKWTDAEGTLHYTDRPPSAGGHLLAVIAGPRTPDATPPPARPAETAPSAPAAPPPDAATLARLKGAVASDVEAHAAQACEEAQAQYRNVIAARHLYRSGPQGDRTYLSDVETEAARIDARRAVEELCGHAP